MSRLLSDLSVVVAVLVGALVTLHIPGVPWPIEWAFGIPLLLLIPGYALVAALFPTAPDRSSSTRLGGVGWPARVGLAMVGSALVVAGTGVLLGALGVLDLTPAVLVVSAVTLGGVLAASVRRRGLPVAERADPLADRSVGGFTSGFGGSGLQNATAFVAALLLVATVAFAVGTPAPSEPYSEATMSLQTGDAGAPGEGVVTLAPGENETLRLTLENHEGENTTYDAVVQLQRLEGNETVVEEERLDSFSVTLAANETRTVERQVTPSTTGERLRLRILVDKDDDGSADLVLRRWVDVVEGSQQ